MGDKRTKQVLTIIVCIGLIIASFFWKMFKDDASGSQDSKSSEISHNAEQQISPEDNLQTLSTGNQEEKINQEVDLNEGSIEGQTVESIPVSEIDTTLYDDTPESESAPEGMDIRIALTNGDVLYSGGYPSGIYKDMMLNIQNYINANIKNPEEITEVTILDESLQEDKENKKLQYDVSLNDGTSLAVEVDLYTFEYQIKIKF